MNQLRATALRLLTSAALISGAGCQPALRSTHATDVPPAVCYHLQFGPWSSAYQAPFAKAAAGLVSPVPDTIALAARVITRYGRARSEEHTSELQSRLHLVCRLLLEKKKKNKEHTYIKHNNSSTVI